MSQAPSALLNENIQATEVRLINSDGSQQGIVAIEQALKIAKEQDLDLVAISPNANPPVCKVMDYGKHVYKQQKLQNLAKKKQRLHTPRVKAMKLRHCTGEGDYIIKRGKVKKFLQNGDKVRVFIHFRGREVEYRDLGKKMLVKMRDDLQEYAEVEKAPVMEGRQLTMMLSPRKHKSE
ncbi:MAG: translation initiation factor IF-3 [Thiotrichales bacterium]|nr:MAG: translation initiation factor IF-3 [Thiotrichales bacterium]